MIELNQIDVKKLRALLDKLEKPMGIWSPAHSKSKLEEDDASRFPFMDFSINEVCKNVIDSFVPSFKKENIKFSYNITGNITMFGNKNLINELRVHGT